MKAEVKQTLKVNLELNASEAIYLKALVQNQENELPEQEKFRRDIFNSLPPFDELYKFIQ